MRKISSCMIKVEDQLWKFNLKVEVSRRRFPCPGLLDFPRNPFFKRKSEIWENYGQWCYHFKFFEEIKLYWLFHVAFGKIRFLNWHDVINSNSWFLAILILQFITSQNGETHFKNLAANAARSLKCVRPF